MENFIISPTLYDALGEELKKNLIEELRKKKAIATGGLIQSLKIDVTPTLTGAVVTLNGNDYVTYIDKGRKAGKYAKISPLKQWVKAKGIATDDAKVTAIAFAINNKIKREGIRPRPILEQVFSQHLPMYNRIIDEALNKDLDKFLNEKIK